MTSLVLSAIAAVLFAVWVALTLWDKRTQQRLQAANLEAAVEAERRWPFLLIEDFTESDEVAPAFVPCRDCYEARRDGYPEAIHDECRPYLVTR